MKERVAPSTGVLNLTIPRTADSNMSPGALRPALRTHSVTRRVG